MLDHELLFAKVGLETDKIKQDQLMNEAMKSAWLWVISGKPYVAKTK